MHRGKVFCKKDSFEIIDCADCGFVHLNPVPQENELKKGQDEILAIRNFGQKSLDELMEKLEEKGYLDVLNEEDEDLSAIIVPEFSD